MKSGCIVRFDPMMNHEVQKARQVLQCGVREILTDGRVPCETHLLLGMQDPGDQAADYAEGHHSDEIIIGAPKRSGNGATMLGSTVRHIVLNAPCPVVSVD